MKSNITSFTKKSILRFIFTTAFGLGIECVDVSRVFHYGPPDSMEAYIQETERWGRDGRTYTLSLHFIFKEAFQEKYPK